jgi:hypothetical protein
LGAWGRPFRDQFVNRRTRPREFSMGAGGKIAGFRSELAAAFADPRIT